MLDVYRTTWITFIILWIINDSSVVAPVVSPVLAPDASGGYGTLIHTYRQDDLQLRSSILCNVTTIVLYHQRFVKERGGDGGCEN